MNIAFYTLGCKVNQYETQVMREAFANAGYNTVSHSGGFDIIIVNSCTVTAESDRKTRQSVRRFRRERPDSIIILTGCMVQAFPENADILPEADIITGNTDISHLTELVDRFLRDGERVVEISSHKPKERFNTPPIMRFDERTRAYMKIEDGCDRFCSYCIIPTARGRVRSKPLNEISSEAESLAANGFSEIVLVGINLSSYGKNEDFDLCDAVDAVCGIPNVKRVRLGSLEPDYITDEMLCRLKKQDKFCPQFHLSLQSGCDETLKRMNRHYDTAFYSDLVKRIRDIFEDAAITTDVMVGFAGETDEEFKKSLDFVKETGFAKTHVFAYSRRAGTVAYGLPCQVSGAEKTRRSGLMIAACAESERAFLRAHIGTVTDVLFETAENGFAEGYTKNYIRVKVKSDKSHTGEILKVKITDASDEFCTGKLIAIEN